MTKGSKEVVECEMRFFQSYEDAQLNQGTYLIVEVEGSVPPTSVVKTVIKDKFIIEPIGDLMAGVGQDNLASARFQLVSIARNIPVPPYTMRDEVYIFECFIN